MPMIGYPLLPDLKVFESRVANVHPLHATAVVRVSIPLPEFQLLNQLNRPSNPLVPPMAPFHLLGLKLLAGCVVGVGCHLDMLMV